MPPLLHTLLSSATIASPSPTLTLSKKPLLSSPHQTPTSLRFSPNSSRRVRCPVLSVPAEALTGTLESPTKPSPAEVSRTIMELSGTGTLSVVTPDGWPLGVGARFVVDSLGAPAVCLSRPERLFDVHGLSSFHVQFEQSGSRTPQCTLLGRLSKPNDELLLKKLHAKWEKKFGEEVQGDLVYLLSVEKVLQIDDFKEDGVWVTPSEYLNAEPDPLRNFAQNIVEEMNTKHVEDVHRLCNVYVESGLQVADVKIIWVDRLGFDLYVYSNEGVFAARIPFPREVSDEKGVKSSINSMTHLAWETERSCDSPDFEKVKFLKKIR